MQKSRMRFIRSSMNRSNWDSLSAANQRHEANKRLLILPHNRLPTFLRVILTLTFFAAWEDTLMPPKRPLRTWADLEGKIAPQVLHAPKSSGDPESSGARSAVHERVVRYLYYHVSGKPWMNHLALVAAVLTARNRDVNTIRSVLTILHARFTELFSALQME